jgi:hypothetical protein
MPVPDSVIVRVGFDAFELTLTLPLAVPLACGLNMTVKVAL